MLEFAKKIIREISADTTKVDLTNFGLRDKDILELKELLEQKPHITEINLTRNNMTRKSGKTLSEIKSLKCIYAGQNNLGDEGARVLILSDNLEYIDLTDNNLTFEIADLIAKRRADGVTINILGNPDLYPEDPSFKEDPILSISTVLFRTNEPTVSEGQRTSGGVVEKAFFERRKNSPEPADPKLEVSLMEQFKAYIAMHPERSDKLLGELNNFCSSIKFGK